MERPRSYTSVKDSAKPSASVDIDEVVQNVQFHEASLESYSSTLSKPLTSEFMELMRTRLRHHAVSYDADLRFHCLTTTERNFFKAMIDENRNNVDFMRRAFHLLGQERAITNVEVAVVSNFIMGIAPKIKPGLINPPLPNPHW